MKRRIFYLKQLTNRCTNQPEPQLGILGCILPDTSSDGLPFGTYYFCVYTFVQNGF